MQRKTIYQLLISLAIFSMLITIAPVMAWDYPDGTTAYEKFGPRARKLLYKLYADDTAEFAALKAGDIDIVDWPLPKVEYDDITANYPGIATVSYGAEYGIFILDLNSNNNEFLGNPPDSAYSNPVYPNPMSDVDLRRAIGYLVDRDAYIADPALGAGFALPMYTAMPIPNAKYLLDVYGNTSIPWAWEYNPAAANATLDAGGFGTFDGEGYRKWDETGTTAVLKFYIRSDHPGRNMIGDKLAIELEKVRLKAELNYATSGECFVEVMVGKNFHMYTGGWSLGSTPDHLILWSWDYYWHPGFCYDYGGHNDPDFNAAAAGIMYANTQDEAVEYAMMAQWAQANQVLGIPLYCVSGMKAYSKTYVGPEAPYTGVNWVGVGNVPGAGIDNGYTFINMHPEGHPTSTAADMTIRYGMKVPEIKQLNPIYASWLYDWNVLGQVYFDSLLATEQYDPANIYNWFTEDFELSTYEHPTLGTCSRVRFSLRDDLWWQDGTPVTMADIYYTYVEIKNDLEANGYPPPWWWSNVESILSFSVIDPYNFEVLLEVKSFWAIYWVGFNIILPKHIWKPIIDTGDPQAFQPDPGLIASGPWRFVEYVGFSHVLLVANEVGSTVGTVTSTSGYTRLLPDGLAVYISDPPELAHRHKIPYDIGNVTMNIDVSNQLTDVEYPAGITADVELEVNGTSAIAPITFGLPPETTVNVGIIHGHYVVAYGWSYYHYVGQAAEGWDVEKHKWLYIKSVSGTEITIDGVTITIASGATAWIHIIATVHLPFPLPIEPSTTWMRDFEWYQWTTPEDIGGTNWYDAVSSWTDMMDDPIAPELSEYPYKRQVSACDYKVDMRDIGSSARAFGSYPGHERWSTGADINGDYKVDMRDIGGIARMFGWSLPAAYDP
jgi:ABC-type transport system substrate-binding protein